MRICVQPTLRSQRFICPNKAGITNTLFQNNASISLFFTDKVKKNTAKTGKLNQKAAKSTNFPTKSLQSGFLRKRATAVRCLFCRHFQNFLSHATVGFLSQHFSLHTIYFYTPAFCPFKAEKLLAFFSCSSNLSVRKEEFTF